MAQKILGTYKHTDKNIPTPGPGESIGWSKGIGTHYGADDVKPSEVRPFRGETVDPFDTYRDNLLERGLWRDRRRS